MIRLVQLRRDDGSQRVAVVDENKLLLLASADSVYDLAQEAVSLGEPLQSVVHRKAHGKSLNYDEIYEGNSNWRFLPPIHHPVDPSRCLASGTGLTHTASAEKRRSMHASSGPENDSIRMYRWGMEGGRPVNGRAGVSPEWFYKGTGEIIRAHGESLEAPFFSEDAGEEPEIAGIYFIDSSGNPRRIGMAIGNEFADHRFERRNYLYLASSKLRQCALGPELIVGGEFQNVPGEVKIERSGQPLWSKAISTGEQNMSHSVANLEHHHFKFPGHRRPGDLHVHFYGADGFSFGEVELKSDDIVQISFEGFGRPLRNPILMEPKHEQLLEVLPL